MAQNEIFQDLIKNTLFVYEKFNRLQQRPWTIESAMIELTKQTGDLAKRVMMYEKYYLSDRENMTQYKSGKKEIGDELSDLLYCIIVIAHMYNIDLEDAHLQALREALDDLHEETPF